MVSLIFLVCSAAEWRLISNTLTHKMFLGNSWFIFACCSFVLLFDSNSIWKKLFFFTGIFGLQVLVLFNMRNIEHPGVWELVSCMRVDINTITKCSQFTIRYQTFFAIFTLASSTDIDYREGRYSFHLVEYWWYTIQISPSIGRFQINHC